MASTKDIDGTRVPWSSAEKMHVKAQYQMLLRPEKLVEYVDILEEYLQAAEAGAENKTMLARFIYSAPESPTGLLPYISGIYHLTMQAKG